MIEVLKQENLEAQAWAQRKAAGDPTATPEFKPKIMSIRHYAFIKKYYDEALPDKQGMTIKNLENVMATKHVNIIKIWV